MTTDITSALKKMLLLFLIVAGLYFAQGFFIPLAIGGVLATLFLPLSNRMERSGINKGLAVFICLLILLVVVAGITFLLGWKISELTGDFKLIRQKALETFGQIQVFIFNNLGISATAQTEFLKTEGPSVGGIIPVMAGSLTKLVTNVILVLAYVFMLLYYRSHIKNFLLKIASGYQREEMEKLIHNVAHVSQQYLIGLAKMIFFLWILYGIGFSLVGLEDAIFFAVLCGLLEIIPYVGNITGTIITLSVAAVHGASPVMLIGIAAIYGVVQFVQGWILEPLIVGHEVKINPLFTILALVIGQLIWGIPGVFLAIPLIAMFKIVCDHIEPLKPYGVLVGAVGTTAPQSGFIKRIKRWFGIKQKHN